MLHRTLKAESDTMWNGTYTGSSGGGTTPLTLGGADITDGVTFTL